MDGGADSQYRWCRKGLGLTKDDSVTNEKDDGRASAENPRRAAGDKSKLAATGDSTWIVNIVLATAAAACFMTARRLRSKAAWRE